MCDSHVNGRLNDTPGVGKEAGPVPWATSPPAFVEQRRAVLRCSSIRTRAGQDANDAIPRSRDHPGALGVSTRVWGGDQPPGGAPNPQPRSDRRHPAAAPERTVPVVLTNNRHFKSSRSRTRNCSSPVPNSEDHRDGPFTVISRSSTPGTCR